MAGNEIGQFIPTSYIWDMAQLQSTDVTSPEFKELLLRLYQNLNSMALSLNAKDSARYNTDEFVNGQLYFPNPAMNSSTATKPEERQVYRKVINFGALPNTATKTVAHGIQIVPPIGAINQGFTFTRIYATASDPINGLYVPIPYASSVANDIIELWVDRLNVNITTGADWSAYTVCYVVLEYLKS